MRTLIRQLRVSTAAVLASGMAGGVASSLLAPGAGNTATAASIAAPIETSRDALTSDALAETTSVGRRWSSGIVASTRDHSTVSLAPRPSVPLASLKRSMA
jgi:hypothetical protein